MKPNLLAVVLAAILFGGIFYFYSNKSPQEEQLPAVLPSQDSTSTATNYDECIAEGNQPLPDAPDKCLTADGHLFISGVVE